MLFQLLLNPNNLTQDERVKLQRTHEVLKSVAGNEFLNTDFDWNNPTALMVRGDRGAQARGVRILPAPGKEVTLLLFDDLTKLGVDSNLAAFTSGRGFKVIYAPFFNGKQNFEFLVKELKVPAGINRDAVLYESAILHEEGHANPKKAYGEFTAHRMQYNFLQQSKILPPVSDRIILKQFIFQNDLSNYVKETLNRSNGTIDAATKSLLPGGKDYLLNVKETAQMNRQDLELRRKNISSQQFNKRSNEISEIEKSLTNLNNPGTRNKIIIGVQLFWNDKFLIDQKNGLTSVMMKQSSYVSSKVNETLQKMGITF